DAARHRVVERCRRGIAGTPAAVSRVERRAAPARARSRCREPAMTFTDSELARLAERVGGALRARTWTLAAAESCTGGWIAKAATDVPGSSSWFVAGYVVYSNDAKSRMLDVPPALIAEHGAVCEAVVSMLAEHARS